jgi:NAD(P)H dehydrogenase (quinone)
MMPASAKANTRDDLNRLGGFSGLLTASPADGSVEEMIPGDLKTAEAFGKNVAEVVKSVKG